MGLPPSCIIVAPREIWVDEPWRYSSVNTKNCTFVVNILIFHIIKFIFIEYQIVIYIQVDLKKFFYFFSEDDRITYACTNYNSLDIGNVCYHQIFKIEYSFILKIARFITSGF